jgi:hypothetical protein
LIGRVNPVISMTSTSSVSYLTPKFDDFLFARIEENGETPLSVLSVLARLGIDPWEEAARLAQLSPAAAATRLASSIAAIPGAPSAYLDAGTVANRLISLLPSPHSVASLSHAPGVRPMAKSTFAVSAILMAFILIIQLVAINRQPTIRDHEAPATSKVLP